MSNHEISRPSPSRQMLRFFEAGHLPQGDLRDTSVLVGELARTLEIRLPDGPEKTAGLRKLLEAKDCFVRSVLPTE